MTETISITGATGDVGGKTIQRLHDMGASVRAVVRRPEQVADFESRGISAALSTLEDTSALARAFDGSDQVLLITAGGREQAVQGRNAVVAAKRAGVRAITHLSTADANPASSVPWARAPWHTDQLIKVSGLEWTILRPSAFMQNLTQFARPVSRGFFPQTTGRGAVAWTDTNDIARVAATVLVNGTHRGEEPVLTGPALLTSNDVAAIFTKVLGRRVRYVHLPSRVFAGAIRLAGADPWTAEGLRHQFADLVRHGRDNANAHSNDVERITGTAATSLENWVRANRATFSR
jgi:uncharacterized protein YbjT (DUF2867 family)